jgi:transcriptional regulator with XRE-family HTH domain
VFGQLALRLKRWGDFVHVAMIGQKYLLVKQERTFFTHCSNQQIDYKKKMGVIMFSEKVKSILKEKGFQQKDFAAMVGTSKEHLNAVLNGRKSAGRKLQEKVAETLGVPLADLLSEDKGQNRLVFKTADLIRSTEEAVFSRHGGSNMVSIPYLSLAVSDGDSMYTSSMEVDSFVGFKSSWLLSMGSPSSMGIVRSSGEDMAPLINDGDFVLVDQDQTKIVNGGIYLALIGGDFKATRLFQLSSAADGERAFFAIGEWEYTNSDPGKAFRRSLIDHETEWEYVYSNYTGQEPMAGRGEAEQLDPLRRFMVGRDTRFAVVGRCLWTCGNLC